MLWPIGSGLRQLVVESFFTNRKFNFGFYNIKLSKLTPDTCGIQGGRVFQAQGGQRLGRFQAAGRCDCGQPPDGGFGGRERAGVYAGFVW